MRREMIDERPAWIGKSKSREIGDGKEGKNPCDSLESNEGRSVREAVALADWPNTLYQSSLDAEIIIPVR